MYKILGFAMYAAGVGAIYLSLARRVSVGVILGLALIWGGLWVALQGFGYHHP